MKKRIVIDARESGTTTGRYVDKLIEHMHPLKPAFEVVILTKPSRIDFFKTIAPDFVVVGSPYKEFSFGEQFGLRQQLKSLKPDLVHFSMTQQPVLYHGRVVTTIHDLTTARFNNPAKNWFIFKCKQLVYRRVIKMVAKKSQKLIVPSRSVKDDVTKYTGVSPARITIIYEAADKIGGKPQPIDSLEDKEFIFYVGRPLPHKNLKRLVDAYARVQESHPKLKLALACTQDKNYELLKRHIAKLNLTNKVLFLGWVDDAQLRWLYENCQAYVFPSLSEGFGLPGLEAMVHGAPVLASKSACLPEIYGPAAHYFDPLDVADMASGINGLLDSPELRQSLIAAGRIQAAKYSWDEAAKQTLAIYRSNLG